MNPLHTLDMLVLTHLAALQKMPWISVAIWVSELGRATTVYLCVAALALVLLLKRRFALAQGIILSVATSGIATLILKGLIARPRPPKTYWAYHEVWYSFPSAHAALVVALYGFLAFMVWRMACSRAMRYLAITTAIALILAIGFTRIYLGVHYLSDIFAGYVLGSACLYLGIWATRTLAHRTSTP